ncbi:MAG: 30S ribosomal protein S15 [Planctomycetota bacterium]|nr:30S ribosomal protein S15 [Planctomycetota bacterium]
MSITAERKTALIEEYRTSENDKGSVQVQVAILTERIRNITEHLRAKKKDYAGRRGLLVLVGKRTRLLQYLQRKNRPEYLRLIEALGLRR